MKKVSGQDNWKFVEIYKIPNLKQLDVRSEIIADYSPINGFICETKINYIWDRRKDLQNITLKVGYCLSQLFANPQRTPAGDRLFGYFGAILNTLSDIMNFSYTLHECPNQLYGEYIAGNQTFNGLIGELQKGSIDVAVSDITISKTRSEVADFSITIAETHSRHV